MAEIKTKSVAIANGSANDSLQIAAYLAEPDAAGSFPGVIVIQEVFGVNAHIRAVTERLAQEGYVAIAPAIYQRTAPGFEVGYSDEELKLGRYHKELTHADQLLSDIQAAADYLKAMPTVKANAIGCIGFCFGGHVAYLAATLPDIQATASFYGAGIATLCPGGGDPTITRTKDIKGMLYAFFGVDDPLIPLDQVDAIETALTQHHIPHRVWRYEGAGHGFMCDQRASYEPIAAAAAWKEVKNLFSATLLKA